MIQATVHFSAGKIVGQFYADSTPISRPQFFSNREQAESYMAKAFNRELNQVQSCWLGSGMKQVLYLTRLEGNE